MMVITRKNASACADFLCRGKRVCPSEPLSTPPKCHRRCKNLQPWRHTSRPFWCVRLGACSRQIASTLKRFQFMLDRQYPATPSALSGHWRYPCFNENWKRSSGRIRRIAQMFCPLSTEHPLHQTPLRVLHSARVARQILWSFNPAKKHVQNLVGNGQFCHAPSVMKHGPNCLYTKDRKLSSV